MTSTKRKFYLNYIFYQIYGLRRHSMLVVKLRYLKLQTSVVDEN